MTVLALQALVFCDVFERNYTNRGDRKSSIVLISEQNI